MKRLRLGMVGGGQGAFIGAVHRIAARMDDRFELVAGALSSDPERAKASGTELGLDPERSYASYEDMAEKEAARPDGIQAVSIVTPNNLHAGPAAAFLKAGIHVICDKPLAATQEQAEQIRQASETSKARFFLTHNYSGYPLIRQAREMVANGDLGKIRVIQAEYAQGWLATDVSNKQADWRTDPSQSGAGAIGDIGTHAFQLVSFVTGLQPQALSADLSSFVEGRQVDDNAHIWLRYDGGAKAMIWVSQVAVGCENGLKLRIYGETGGLEWHQENPNQLLFTSNDQPTQILTRGGPTHSINTEAWTRVPPGHPEGYLEGFANLYQDIADQIQGRTIAAPTPDLTAGLEGMWFIAACQESHAQGNAWIKKGP